jgi:hypothetical protein
MPQRYPRLLSLEVLAVHLAFLGVEFEVHEPPELVETVRALAGTFGRAARWPGRPCSMGFTR